MITREKPFVAGIGASAGGLEAISQLISHLKPDIPCAYVVLQHLSPSHRSMMVEILGRETSLMVREATQGDELRAGTIYVVPANSNALLKDGRLQMVTPPAEVVPRPSINQFLISLAAEEGDAAIGIVLSGTGSDGTAGLRAIQSAGGFTLVQSPETAKYDGMPRAAIEAGVVDHILSATEIATKLPQLLEVPATDALALPPDALDRLLQRLREQVKLDFSGYKAATLLRRIRRREVATGNKDLPSYLEWIEEHPAELDILARDILISVTSFFRDREAFEALRVRLQKLYLRKLTGSEFRVWVAGCASGEEAYSMAILFAQILDEQSTKHRIQIFATDIDDEALNVARRGVYPAAALAEVPPELLAKYFRPVNQTYEAGKQLRDMIVFARHNLVSDPPFLRLDVVSCRNVLIYFDAPLQSRVLQSFHFGLAKDGLLFLGRSESVSQAEQLFAPQDRRERLFHKIGESLMAPGSAISTPIKIPVARRDSKPDQMLAALVSHFGLMVLLCDADGNIQYSAGEVARYLRFPTGNARLSIGDAAVPAIRGELLTLLHHCNRTGQAQRGRRRKLGKEWVRAFVEPLQASPSNALVVLVVPDRAPKVEAEVVGAVGRDLEGELAATRDHVQTLIEEMATANEEMQALNEEAQASSEELQASNEEMEAANEELQATNEELVSLNEEFNVRTQELLILTTEYTHLYDALEFPILVFDRACQLTRFNGPASRRFDLRPTSLHQHVSQLRLVVELFDLQSLLNSVLAHCGSEDAQINQSGRTFRLGVTPGLDPTGQVITLVVTLIDMTDITQAQLSLAESQSRLTALMENTTVIFAMKEMNGKYLFANRRFQSYFQIGDDYVGKSDFDLLPPKLAADLWGLDMQALREQSLVTGEHLLEASGGPHYLRSAHQVLLDGDGKPMSFIVEAEDITDRKNAEEQMRIAAKVFEQTADAILVSNSAGIIQTVNSAFTAITGYTQQEIVGASVDILKSDRHDNDFYEQQTKALGASGFWQGEVWSARKGGEVFPEWRTINRIDNQFGTVEHYVSVFSDISQIKASQHKVEYLATHDALTGLPNRALFQDHLRHALAQARRTHIRLALLFIDLDNFKTVNDTLGHDIGDEILIEASSRLHIAMRDVDSVCRFGGDEFTVLLVDCSVEAADGVARRIVDDLSRSYEIFGQKLFISASIGVAFYPEDGTDSAELIKKADSAMYRAKEQGRNRVEFFKADLHLRLLKQAALTTGLREALRIRRLRLVFQPKYSLAAERRLLGAEALLRWRDPELGDVPPSEFIHAAEASGLILEVDVLVQEMLIEKLAGWSALGLSLVPVAFNASPRSFREPTFAEKFLARAEAAGVPHNMLQIEITEGALLESSAHVVNNLDRLHAAGIRISVDDFGTGYSSLSYLKRLPIDELKIDKSFVDGLGQDKEDEAITRAVLGLAHALDLSTVAEGVETERQLNWLIDQGCKMGQGFYLKRPLEADDFEDLIAKFKESGK